MSEKAPSGVQTLEKPQNIHQQLPSASHEIVTDQMRAHALTPEAPDLGGERSDKDLGEVIKGVVVGHEPAMPTDEEKVVKDSARGLGRIFRWGDRKDEDHSEPEDSNMGRAGQTDDETSSNGSTPTDDDYDDETLVTAPSTGGRGPTGTGRGGNGDGGRGEPPRDRGGGGGPEDIFSPEFPDNERRNWRLEFTRRAAEINGIEDPIERETREKDFLDYIIVLDRMASSKRYFGVGVETERINQKLADSDAEDVANITGNRTIDGKDVPADDRKLMLEGLLDQLDTLEYNKKGLVGALIAIKALDEDGKPLPLDVKGLPLGEASEIEARKKDLEQIKRELIEVENQVSGLSENANLVANRKKLKKDIDRGLENLRNTQNEQELLDEREGDPSPFEVSLEQQLFEKKKPDLEDEIDNFVAIPSYSELRTIINNPNHDKKIILQIRTGPDAGKTREANAEELREWYFYKARELGFFNVMDSQLSDAYEGLRNKIHENNFNSIIPVGLISKTSEEIESQAKREEEAASWNINRAELIVRLMNDSVNRRSSADAADEADEYIFGFKGIKADFMARGNQQIQLALNAQLAWRDAYKKGIQVGAEGLVGTIDYLRINRMGGEFNVSLVEFDLQARDEKRIQETRERLYDYQWRYSLKGRNRQEIEDGANQAVDDLLEGAATFDVNTVMQRMNDLSNAVSEYGKPAGMSEQEIKYLQQNTVDRISFHLGQWFGMLVQMDSAAAVVSNWASNDGYDRLRIIPTMMGGLVGKALELRYRPEYRFLYRPEGWAGQLYKNQLTQRFIRANLEELMADELMRYEVVGDTREAKYKTRMNLNGRMTKEEFDKSFVISAEHPRDALAGKRKEYFDYLEQAKTMERTIELLSRIKQLRLSYSTARMKYNKSKQEAESAAKLSSMVMDFFLESAKIGAPSIRMRNRMKPNPITGILEPEEIDINGRTVEIKGDDMSIEDITLILEYVVMQEAKKLKGKLGSDFNFEDNGALIRWRSRRYLAGEERDGKRRDSDWVGQTNFYELFQGEELRLRKGFETTGLTNSEFKALVAAFKKLKAEGFKAKFEFKGEDGKTVEKTISQILKEMDTLAPVLNNYIGEDIQGGDYFFHALLAKAASKGEQPFVARIRKRLKWFGLDDVLTVLPKLTVSQQREQLEQVIENSRSFHDMVTEMVYYLGTRKKVDQVLEEENYVEITHNASLPETSKQREFGVRGIYADRTQFDTKDFIFGFPNITLGGKRIKYLNANWMLRIQEKVARGASMLPFVRIYMPALSQDLDGRNLLEVIWNMDKDFFDLPWLMAWGAKVKNAVDFRKGGETSIDAENHKAKWGFFDKLLADAERLWGLFPNLEEMKKDIKGESHLHPDVKERVIATMEEVLVRYIPMINLMDKSLSYDREAGGSGAADEAMQKVTLKFLGWLLSSGGSERRLQGGLRAHGDAEAILRFILEKESYRNVVTDKDLGQIIHWGDKSIWERLWEKLKPRTPGIPLNPPLPTNIDIAA